MTGRASRSRGHRFELDVARYLTDVWCIDVVTTRNMRGGLQSISGDLAHRITSSEFQLPLGWSIEVKDVAASAVPTWLTQAHESAGGLAPYVVIHKQRRAPLVDAHCWLPSLVWTELVDAFHVPDGPRWLPLDTWAALAAKNPTNARARAHQPQGSTP